MTFPTLDRVLFPQWGVPNLDQTDANIKFHVSSATKKFKYIFQCFIQLESVFEQYLCRTLLSKPSTAEQIGFPAAA